MNLYNKPENQTPTFPEKDQILSVSALTRAVKSILEPAFREVWVRGEVSNLRQQSSGHSYFTLKDSGSQLPAALFRRDAARCSFNLQEGSQVIVFGQISVYEPRGGYQLVVRDLLPDGTGKLQQQFEALKQKLASEGLFDQARKRPLPALPSQLVVITSPTGAALQDFLSILKRRRWPGLIRVLPVRVQGSEAGPEIVAALSRANREKIGELVVLCRGGGSLEDLWPFNEEIVARAVSSSTIPVISAVGHEIDFTLSDFAADRRAETPSAAAETIANAFQTHLDRLNTALRSLHRETSQILRNKQQHLELQLSRLRLASPMHRIEICWMRLDETQSRLCRSMDQSVDRAKQHLHKCQERLLRTDPAPRLAFERERLRQLSQRLLSSGPDSALKRGYVILRNQTGEIVSDKNSWPNDEILEAQFRDGRQPVRKA